MHQIVQEHLPSTNHHHRHHHPLSSSDRVAVVVDPSSPQQPPPQVVATSWDERRLQGDTIIKQQNPLATPILLAIQGVSRRERRPAAITSHGHDRDHDRDRQEKAHYLCTGYHLYCNYEPTIFEAMACVHSRLGRLVFTDHPTTRMGGVWDKAITRHSIHGLPGTNHHYRVFQYQSTEDTKSGKLSS
jgi:tRNA(Arg) A34 adenosine deaminase TadA